LTAKLWAQSVIDIFLLVQNKSVLVIKLEHSTLRYGWREVPGLQDGFIPFLVCAILVYHEFAESYGG